VTVVPVTKIAAESGQEENWDLAGESEKAEQNRRLGQPLDEPELRSRLHPRANERDKLAREEELKVAVLEGAEAIGHEQNVPTLDELRQSTTVTMLQ
jgi:hypothetical protein